MIGLILIALAAICNSIMDVIIHDWHDSIFSKFKEDSFWWKWFHRLGWLNKYVDESPKEGRKKWLWGLINKPVQICDAWHFFKMLMLIFIFLACVSLIAGYEYSMVGMFYDGGAETFIKLSTLPWIIKCRVPINAPWWNWNMLIYTALWYVAWNGTFMLFYKWIWVKYEKK